MSYIQCERCREEKPPERFPDMSQGAICQTCMSGVPTSHLDKELQLRAKAIAGQLVDVSADDLGAELPKVKSIISDIYSQFGGPSGYAMHLHFIITELSKRRPLPTSVGQLMVNLMKLHHSIEQTDADVHASELTDEQLKREHELALVRIALDASADPDKRNMLNAILGKQGLKIAEMDGAEAMADVQERVLSGEPLVPQAVGGTAGHDATADAITAEDITDEDLMNFLGE